MDDYKLKIYYVDAENVGLNLIDEEVISILDKVFVFTNNENLKTVCNANLLGVVSGYPSGQNQADFYIIAHLASILSNISKAEKNAIEFIIFSKDKNLCKAFDFQCSLAGAKSKAPIIEEEGDCILKISEKILKLTSSPITVTEIQNKLKIQQSVFTTSFNQLIKTGKIKRQQESKKHWLRV